MRSRIAQAAACLLAFSGGAAEAFVLSGRVSGGSVHGRFVKLDPANGFAVGRDTFENGDLHAFDEDQNILIDRDIRVEVGPAGGTIEAGSVVASHYVFFDPARGAIQRGFVDFDSPILGVATSQATLAATDFLANTDVSYLNPGLRGLEWEDRVWIDPENPFRLHVNWAASSPGDYIRVFTAQSPGV